MTSSVSHKTVKTDVVLWFTGFAAPPPPVFFLFSLPELLYYSYHSTKGPPLTSLLTIHSTSIDTPLATICPIPLPLLQPYLLTLDVFQHLDTLALEPPLQRPNLSVSICLFRRRRPKGFKTCCRSSFVPEVGLYYEWGGKSSFVLFTVRMLLVAVRFLFSLSGLVSVVSKTHFEVISFSSLSLPVLLLSSHIVNFPYLSLSFVLLYSLLVHLYSTLPSLPLPTFSLFTLPSPFFHDRIQLRPLFSHVSIAFVNVTESHASPSTQELPF